MASEASSKAGRRAGDHPCAVKVLKVPTKFGTPSQNGVTINPHCGKLLRKSEQMHRRYNTTQAEDLHAAAAKLQKYTAYTALRLSRVRL